MGIGEDIPALIPISIAVVFIVLGISMLFINYFEKSEALSMHSFAMTVLEKQIEEQRGVFEEKYLDSNDLAVKSNRYETMLLVKTDEKNWTYGSVTEPDLVISLPCLVKNETNTSFGIISLSVKK